ncbi:FixH family protein [Mesobacillus subterraneus]|uniref:FixH family protein n=1 Tax=Mesobacillus subterraneus TaxID=285983 RepID=UPI001CFED49A|nr:FixH family protein [Mesobacillus subterraneus]WLR57388.1 FixH family protein [Mesobacillus subterraneus]
MKKLLFFFITVMLLLTACSAGSEPKEDALEDVPELLEVSIITPEKIEMNTEITVKAEVLQGEEKVTNADEVKFEIWKSGQEDHEMIPALNEKDGTYSIKKSFSEGGNYFIVAHTTANRMHSMPKKEVIVLGNESNHAHTADGENENHDDQHSDQGHDDHHNSEVTFDFHAPSTIKSHQPAELTVKIAQEEQLISGANVRFEIWEENETKHQFINTKEVSTGTYSADYTFPAKGLFILKIHVEKGNIHDHTEKSIEVGS